MNESERFFALLQSEMAVTLATAAEGRVTMRAVSPVPYRGGMLMLTYPNSVKYRQLRDNPRCCVAAGGFYAECRAECLGDTMRPENEALRAAYTQKFPDAFDANAVFGGLGAEFFLLRPTRLSGWTFENGVPTPDGVPTVPFEIQL